MNKMEVKTNGTGMFKEAVNQQAFLKVGIMGFAASGKTFSASLIARGIVERLKSKKPVFFLDTETGSDFMKPKFKQWGIPLHVSNSNAFIDLIAGVKEAEENASVLIIDSISHFWKEVQDAYKKAHGRNRLLFQDWGPIKDQWGRFTNLYLNSKVHIIMCGRAGYEYDFFEDESGAKQLAKTGTKMKAETDMGYEPSLLLEMVRERIDNEDKSVEAKLSRHVCYVLKDRTDLIDGKKFVNPTFKDFEPVFDCLNIGGDHVGVVTNKNSTELFDKNSDKNWYEEKRRREVLIEELQGELIAAYPGQSSEEKRIKVELIFETFGTRSWIALSDFKSDKLKEGLKELQVKIKGVKK